MFIIFLIGAATILHTAFGRIVHIILYSTLGRRTALCRYASCLTVSIFLLSLLANSWYSIWHCFFIKEALFESENQTPRNLKGTLWGIVVIEKEEVTRLN